MATTTDIRAHGLVFPATPQPWQQSGFSLVELAVVIIVVTLLLGSLLIPLATQVENRRYNETEKQLEHIREALIGFALAKRYLPCPAKSDSDGTEDRTGTVCTDPGTGTKRVGFVPWVTLGVTQYDAWDNLIRYSVDPTFAQSDPASFFALNDTGDIQIKASATVDLTNIEIPAIVLSHGKNGFGATTSSGSARVTPGGWDNTFNEQVNATADTVFYVRERTENTGATGGEYDDIVAWVSLNQLFARMVSAGRLP